MSTRPILQLAMMALLSGCLPSLSLDPDGGAPGDPGNKNPGKPTITDAGVVIPAGADLSPPPDMAVDPVLLFNAEVAPILQMSCAGCHNKVGGIGPGFLAPDPDVLTTMLAYPGLIGLSPETSRIYVKGVHEGPGLTGTQKPVISDWIKQWNLYKPKSLDGGASKPTVTPFAPVMGANTIDLSVIDSTLAGQKITFTAKMIGTTLQLSTIEIVAAAGMGVHVVHPLWVTWDAMMTPTPDPVDSFSNLDETVMGGQSASMGPGTLFLPDFATTMTLNVVFATLEAKSGTADGGAATLGCKNVASWTTNSKPQLTNNCTSCHGGSNTSATMALPLQTANGDTQNCANTLGEVDLTTPANGRLYSYPNPANPNNGHPFHFPDTTTYQAFTTAVGTWIANEK
jgi:hypothetical protein